MNYTDMRVTGCAIDTELYEITIGYQIEGDQTDLTLRGLIGYIPEDKQLVLVEYDDEEFDDEYVILRYKDNKGNFCIALDVEYALESDRQIFRYLRNFALEKRDDKEFIKELEKVIIDYQI